MTQLTPPLTILHCITSLDSDGAQQMLLKLCGNLPPENFRHIVVNLRTPTELAGSLETLGVTLYHLGLRRALPTFGAVRAIAKTIDRHQPDVLQGWMYHGNIAVLAGRSLARHRPPVLWNIRKAVDDLAEYRPLTRLVLRIGATLSSRVDGVISCGQYIADQHTALGYSKSNSLVIPNGFDTMRFHPSDAVYRDVRTQLGLPPAAPLVGMTARFHPHKDHPTFLRAAARVIQDRPDVHFVLAGRGLTEANSALGELVSELGLTTRLHLLGEHSQVEKLLPAFDVYCHSSSAEGFPNALGEAMACGVPCVSTDAGASAEAVGDSGIVVPTKDFEGLAKGVLTILNLPPEKRRELGKGCRKRVESLFSLPVIAAKYGAQYARAAGRIVDPSASDGPAKIMKWKQRENREGAV